MRRIAAIFLLIASTLIGASTGNWYYVAACLACGCGIIAFAAFILSLEGAPE